MEATYKIIKTVPMAGKFACYVKFNEGIDAEFYNETAYPEGGEYWECDVPTADKLAEQGLTLSEFVAQSLITTATSDLERWNNEDKIAEDVANIEIVDGEIAL